jgi:alkaline phosphatase D
VRGVEFGGTSVTSPSVADVLSNFGLEGALLNQLIVDKNDEVEWHDETKRGYVLITLTREDATADFMSVDTIQSKTFLVATSARWKTRFGTEPTALERV